MSVQLIQYHMMLYFTDLSMTQSEDDLDVSGVRTRRQRASAKRQSLEQPVIVSSKKARRSSTVCY